MKWPGAMLNERGRYLLDRQALQRNAMRDLVTLFVALVLGIPLFEITLIYIVDALARVTLNASHIRLAKGRPRGAIASPVLAGSQDDPKAMALRMLVISVLMVLLCGTLLIAQVVSTYGTGGVEPLRALTFSLLYTVPFALYEHWRWLGEKRDRAVPHILSRDLSWLILFASVMASIVGGVIMGVAAFVLLRAINEALDLVPSWSVDGLTWTTQWQSEWDALRTDGSQG